MGRRIGKFTITQELLLRALCLPEGTMICGAELKGLGDVEFLVQHEDLPEVETPAQLSPKYNAERTRTGPGFSYIEITRFSGWK